MSPVEMHDEDESDPARSPLEESAPGSYDDPAVVLTLPRTTAVTSEPVATPIAIKILQLRDDSLLRNTVYQLLDQDPAKHCAVPTSAVTTTCCALASSSTSRSSPSTPKRASSR